MVNTERVVDYERMVDSARMVDTEKVVNYEGMVETKRLGERNGPTGIRNKQREGILDTNELQ